MKTITKISVLTVVLFLATSILIAQQQIAIEGYVNQGLGFASWNADGSGPEPAATGHINPNTGTASTYYAASYDYITQNPNHAGFHMMPGMTGFPAFEQALSTNGFTPEDVMFKIGLGSYEEDLEGIDWLTIGNDYYSNHYNMALAIEIDGEIILSGHLYYFNHHRVGTANYWYLNSSYSNLITVATSAIGLDVAEAFLEDLNGKEIIISIEMMVVGVISSNGRSGYTFDLLNGIISVGNPSIPFKGLHSENEGFAGWDADGTGTEPYGNGHLTQAYYGASVDYDGINPDPNACLGHFLNGSTGFLNTLIQLQYRGYQIGDLKIKYGLCSLGPDISGEDWGYENGQHWCNYYNNAFWIELNGEPILQVMTDTLILKSNAGFWDNSSSVGKLYDISTDASDAAQYVAKSILIDVGTHYLISETYNITFAAFYNQNGRDGAIYNINSGALKGVHRPVTFIAGGNFNGTLSKENSPYFIDGHLAIADGETLTIEPGVKVAVRGPYHFNVQGCVKAEGTADDPIIFTRSNPNIWWDGFDYNETPETNSASIFDHCVFEYGYAQGTLAAYNSGGIFAVSYFDKIKVLNSTFRFNKADIDDLYPPCGGAIALWESSPFIQSCIFHDNFATSYAGAIFGYLNSAPVISNCLFFENESERGGAVAYYDFGKGVLMNNTFADNHAGFGGAVYFYNQSMPELINNIMWNNTAYWGGTQAYFSSSPSVNFYYNNISGGASGFAGYYNGAYLFNLDDDPLFNDTIGALPYSLLEESPCFNRGTPDTSAWYFPQYLPQNCLCGNPRVCNGRIDIGAYELPEIVGIHDIKLTDEPWLVYPNPFTEKVTIQFDLTEPSEVTIELTNLMGDRVRNSETLRLHSGQNELLRNLSDLPDGVYFLTIRYTDTVLTKKLLKTR